MGAHNMLNFVRKFASEQGISIKKEVSPICYANKKLAIDASFILYKYIIAIRNKGYDKTSKDGKFTSHLYAIMCYTRYLMSHDIQPIWVFDNYSTSIKNNTLEERKAVREEAKSKCDMITDKNSQEYKKNFKKSFVLKKKYIDECKLLLTALGQPYVESIEEADQQCAALTLYDFPVDGVIGEDSDMFVFGCTKLLRNFSAKYTSVDEYDLSKIIHVLNTKIYQVRRKNKMPDKELTYEDFVKLSILMGCDYCEPIKNISVYELFIKFVVFDFNVESIIKHIITGYYPKKNVYVYVPPDYMKQFNDAYEYYTQAKVNDYEKINFNFNNPKIDDVYKILHVECNFDFNYVKGMIQDTIIYHNKMNKNKLGINMSKYKDVTSKDITDEFYFTKHELFENLTMKEILSY